MFLKSLEIRGFKSFADKTEINFNKGITAIVGPNGSGKSNISDAVRWVLGEQSIKNLRGGKMEDVIFAGTQYRKPVSLAQVSITLDNTNNEIPIDYSDLTVTRRIYRSGESEYFINHSKCRLKDIQELFMDTGIGKEGYSIIGQGKIDAILSGKPEDKRKLLEEAAGIVKFKTRKEESEKKLSLTEQNLERINDILVTYEESLKPLEIEKDKAKKFSNLSNDLKFKEINLILYNIDNFKKLLDEKKEKIKELTLNLNDYLNDKNFIKSEYDKFQNQLENFEIDIENNKKNYYDKKSKHKDILSEIDVLNEKIKNLDLYIDKNTKEINALNEKTIKLENQKNISEKSLDKNKDEQFNLNKDIENYEKQLVDKNSEISNDNNLLKDTKIENEKISNKIIDLNNQNLIMENQKNELKNNLKSIEASFENLKNLIGINITTKKELENQKNNILKCIDEFELDIKNSKKTIKEKTIKLNTIQFNLNENHKKLNMLEANKNVLVNLENEYEGYSKTIKKLMQNLSEVEKKNCRVLGEALSVPKYLEIAIEIALGSSISNIITKDDFIAKTLINKLKKYKLGRATFLPLNIIHGKCIKDDTIKNLNGYIGIASKLINYDSSLNGIFEYLLGRTIIAKDLDSAVNISKRCNLKFKVVTLDGEVVSPGGALTGGSIYYKNTGIISRKRKIEELGNEIVKTNEIIAELSVNLKKCNIIIKEFDDKCLNLKDEIHYKNIEIAKIEGKISNLTNDTEKLNNDLILSKNKGNDLLEKLNSYELKFKDNLNNLNNLNTKKINNEAIILKLQNKLNDKNKYINDSKENIMALKISKAKLDEIVTGEINELNRISKELIENKNKIGQLKNEINEFKQNYTNISEKIMKNKENIKDIIDSIKEFEDDFKKNEIQKINLKEKINRYKLKIEENQVQISNKEKEIHKEQIVNIKSETEIENIYQKLNDEYDINYAQALEFKLNDFNLNQFKNDVMYLKNEISKLGIVNLGAIDEYEDIKKKYDFLSSQKEDLIKSREELFKVIEEMTKKMRIMFKDNFDKLKIYFNETFKELFKGGRADLILGDGDELTSDIFINVEPPGKKLQNINLMSGGEKVLSAIALLFAILKMKPTPFCILDEIEAALDDANVIRYAEFLKAFSDNVQFIIITHRKGSMSASDVMYGITMQEKGVSKVVSIDLKNEKN